MTAQPPAPSTARSEPTPPVLVSVRWHVPIDHPAFEGHFPGQPLLPGVTLLSEALEALIASPAGAAYASGVRLSQVKFLHPVRPGTDLTVSLEGPTAGGVVRFTVHNSDRVAASGSLEPPIQGGALP